MSNIYIKPAKGKLIRDHVYPHPFIPEDGLAVEWHPYWARKLVKGDVVIAPAPKTKATKSKED